MSRYAPFEPPASADPPMDAPGTSDDLVIRDGFAIVFGPVGRAWIERAGEARRDITPDARDLAAELFGAPNESYDAVN
jgi:hypothetical protein